MRGPQLTSPQMSVDAHVSRRAAQTLPLSVWNMLLPAETVSRLKSPSPQGFSCSRLRISILFGHPKINNMNGARPFGGGPPNQEVVRLDVPIYEILLVYRLNS